MGYEIPAMTAFLEMYFQGKYPATIPGGPRAYLPEKDGPEPSPIGVNGGTINHAGQAMLIKLTWALEKEGTRDFVALLLFHVLHFLDYQLRDSFMCRGGTCEQTPPSHGQQHLSYALGLLGIAVRYQLVELQAYCEAWLLAYLAVARPFVVLSGLPNPPAILLPGARAYTYKEPGSKKSTGRPFGGRCSALEQTYAHLVLGLDLELPNPDPLESIDEASLYVLRSLPPAVVERLRERAAAREIGIPPLRWPIRYQRRGSDFMGYLVTAVWGGDMPVQRAAGWINGEAVYRFNDDPEPRIPGAAVEVFAGAPIVVKVEPGGPEPRLPPGPASRGPGLADLPPKLRANVEAGRCSLDEAIERARRNYGGFAKRFPAPASEALP